MWCWQGFILHLFLIVQVKSVTISDFPRCAVSFLLDLISLCRIILLMDYRSKHVSIVQQPSSGVIVLI